MQYALVQMWTKSCFMASSDVNRSDCFQSLNFHIFTADFEENKTSVSETISNLFQSYPQSAFLREDPGQNTCP